MLDVAIEICCAFFFNFSSLFLKKKFFLFFTDFFSLFFSFLFDFLTNKIQNKNVERRRRRTILSPMPNLMQNGRIFWDLMEICGKT